MTEWALIKNLKPVQAYLATYPQNKRFLLKALRSSTGKKLQLGQRFQELAESSDDGSIPSMLETAFSKKNACEGDVAMFCKALRNAFVQYELDSESKPKLIKDGVTHGLMSNFDLDKKQKNLPKNLKRKPVQELKDNEVSTELEQMNNVLLNIAKKNKTKEQVAVSTKDEKKSVDTADAEDEKQDSGEEKDSKPQKISFDEAMEKIKSNEQLMWYYEKAAKVMDKIEKGELSASELDHQKELLTTIKNNIKSQQATMPDAKDIFSDELDTAYIQSIRKGDVEEARLEYDKARKNAESCSSLFGQGSEFCRNNEIHMNNTAQRLQDAQIKQQQYGQKLQSILRQRADEMPKSGYIESDVINSVINEAGEGKSDATEINKEKEDIDTTAGEVDTQNINESNGRGSEDQKRAVYDDIPIETPAQKAFDKVTFDLFSHVPPGFGNGADNKLFRMDINRKRKLEWMGNMFMPRAYDGPEQGLAPQPYQFKNVMSPEDYNSYNTIRQIPQILAKRARNSSTEATSVLRGEPYFQASSKGLRSRLKNIYTKAIDLRTPLFNPVLPAGRNLPYPNLTKTDPCVDLNNSRKPVYNKLGSIYAMQGIHGINYME